jgi:hypothetical protein
VFGFAGEFQSLLHRPYVGVTGYTSLDQANAVSSAVEHLLGNRVLMDGYLLRSMDVSDRWNSPDDRYEKYAARFIRPEAASEVFESTSRGSLRIVHYCTNIESQLDAQLQDCIDRFGQGIDGFQVNWLARPDASELGEFKSSLDQVRHSMGLARLC